MGLRVGSVVINCADLDGMSRFWCSVLGLRPGPVTENGTFRVLGGDPVNLSLQVARTPVTARDQMHVDLYTAEQEAQVARLIALGASLVRTHHDPDDDYVVLADPEGNEFCVCAVPDPSPSA
jgi:catechol 2,3-dioxygenase-like lactoylglutathione lyase family enzyme